MCKKRHVVFLVLLGWIPALSAHPVAFKGAWGFLAFNQADMQDWQLAYSFERKFSLGVNFIHDTMEGQDRYFLIPRLAWLVKRWNGSDYQANIYTYGGLGAATKNGRSGVAGEVGVEADYETREVYFSGKATVIGASGFDSLAMYQARAGFAPYVGNSGDLHTWLIAQAQYFPFAHGDSVRVGPVMRFFYRNVLWEAGVTTKGSSNFNFMVHW